MLVEFFYPGYVTQVVELPLTQEKRCDGVDTGGGDDGVALSTAVKPNRAESGKCELER